jgi:hypothetical protein
MPISSAHGSQAERKGKRPEKEAYKMKTKTKNEKRKTQNPYPIRDQALKIQINRQAHS